MTTDSPMSRAVQLGPLGTKLRAYFSAVWDEALQPIGQAHPSDRPEFLSAHVMGTCNEFRFQGAFGFGGKVRTSADLRCKVDFYPEDATAGRRELQAKVNDRLADLYDQFFSAEDRKLFPPI